MLNLVLLWNFVVSITKFQKGTLLSSLSLSFFCSCLPILYMLEWNDCFLVQTVVSDGSCFCIIVLLLHHHHHDVPNKLVMGFFIQVFFSAFGGKASVSKSICFFSSSSFSFFMLLFATLTIHFSFGTKGGR